MIHVQNKVAFLQNLTKLSPFDSKENHRNFREFIPIRLFSYIALRIKTLNSKKFYKMSHFM